MDKLKTIAEGNDNLKYYMLYYKLVPDILVARIPFRESHMNILKEYSAKGLVFVGAEVIEGFPATFMFRGKTDDIVKDWLNTDPYFNNGLVLEHRYNEIILVAGELKDK